MEQEITSPSDKQELREQTLAIFGMHGIAVSEEVIALMTPLLNGQVGVDTHLVMLKTKLEALEDAA